MKRRVQMFTVWLLEIVGEAVGTAALFFIIPAFQDFSGAIHEFRLRPLAGIAVMVLIEFGLTGYLVTTALASAFLRRRGTLVYPAISAALYLVHSEIFFVLAGNRLVQMNSSLAIQILGASIAFGCTFTGNRMIGQSGFRRQLLA